MPWVAGALASHCARDSVDTCCANTLCGGRYKPSPAAQLVRASFLYTKVTGSISGQGRYHECRNKWNNQSVFPSLPVPPL